jgi:hypothetical protein
MTNTYENGYYKIGNDVFSANLVESVASSHL